MGFDTGTFNIGTDKSIVVIDNNTGQPIDLGGRVIDFKSDPKTTLITSMPIDNQGYDQHRLAYGGWTGSIMVDRNDSSADAIEAANEVGYHQGSTQQYYTITETITNADQSQSVFQYNGVIMWLQSSGSWRKDQKVELTWQFESIQRVQIS